ncbi:MAG: ABC transporter permease [Gemmatimonadetes bacterium]|nr:ABC transporter permease [Gemmatimonadota bacterium]
MMRSAKAAGWLLGALVVASVLGPAFASSDPSAIGDVIGARLTAPLARDGRGVLHLLGTDRFGRDLLVRLLVAARLSLAVGVVGAILAATLGAVVGAVSGWWRGWLDRLLMGAADVALAIPRLVLLIVCAALWQPGAITTVLVLMATGWMSVARLVRSEVQGLAVRPFTDAARALGAGPARVLWRHVVPQAMGPVLVSTTLGIGNAILLEGGLSFLGLGVQPPAPSWGNMIAGGRDLLLVAPWVALAPGVLLVCTVACCTVIGDALEARLREGDAAR